MARTNFLTMYDTFARHQLREQLGSGRSLYDTVRELARAETVGTIDIVPVKFRWKPEDLRKPIDVDWPGKAEDMRTGELTVMKFLDTHQ